MEGSIFKEKEREIIESVEIALRAFNFIKPPPTISEILQNILQIFEDLRKKIATHIDDEGLKTEIQIETEEVKGEKVALKELRLLITQETRERILASLAWPTKKSKKTNILILTPEGYRQSTQEKLDSERFHSSGKARLAKYSSSSYTNIKSFMDNVHQALKKAINEEH